MKGLLPTILMAAAAAGTATAQTSAAPATDEEGVTRAAMNYMDGALQADADRVARGVHEELNKVVIRTSRETGRQSLSYNTHTTLVEIVRGLSERMAEVEDKSVDVTIFDIGNDMAAARAVGQLWYDFLQLAKIDGEWRIVNVLWAQNRGEEGAQEDLAAARAAVEATARDYIEGAYSGDGERMERALHPELNKVLLNKHRQTGEQYLYKMGASNLVEGTRAGLGTLEEDQRNIEVEIYDVSHDIASVKVSSAMYVDHLQVGRVNGEWKIINVLWVPNPDRPQQNRG
jgi:hypothetical protein